MTTNKKIEIRRNETDPNLLVACGHCGNLLASPICCDRCGLDKNVSAEIASDGTLWVSMTTSAPIIYYHRQRKHTQEGITIDALPLGT